MLILSNNIITFLSIMSILFISLFSIIDNNILITVQSSIENTTQTNTNNSSNQSDPTSNLTNAIQWKKFVNETIGISFEYPSNWGEGTSYYFISPNLGELPIEEYPSGTFFRFSDGQKLPPLEGNLEVITRMEAAMLLEASSEDFKYEIWEKPTIEKYTIDGEKASSFSYRKISNYDRDSFFLSKSSLLSELVVEKIFVIHDGKFFNFEFSFPIRSYIFSIGEFNYENITTYNYEDIIKIKDHMFNSIRWLN